MTVTHTSKTFEPIITSLLDNDLYKFTMLQAMLHQFPQTHGVYRFRCRNNEDTLYPLADIKEALRLSVHYKFIAANKVVSSRHENRSIRCWLFRRPATQAN